jgi:hypothetical protein
MLTGDLMATNRHTCCICNTPREPVEKHQIHGDPAKNNWNNLAVQGIVFRRNELRSKACGTSVPACTPYYRFSLPSS